MPRSGKILFSAYVALCVAKTSLSATAVFFLYYITAVVFFNFAASAFKHVASAVGLVGRSGKIMLCGGGFKGAALFALCVASVVKRMTGILRAFVESGGNARTTGSGTFSVPVTFEVYFAEIAPRMLVSAGYCRNHDGNIASLPVRRRCGDIHRSAVHGVDREYLIIAGGFVVKPVVPLHVRADGGNFRLVSIRTRRAPEPYTRIGIKRAYFTRYLYADFGIYGLRITYIRHSFGNDKIHLYGSRYRVLPCGVPKFYILAFAEFRAKNLHISFEQIYVFGQFIVFFRHKRDADTIRYFLLD